MSKSPQNAGDVTFIVYGVATQRVVDILGDKLDVSDRRTIGYVVKNCTARQSCISKLRDPCAGEEA